MRAHKIHPADPSTMPLNFMRELIIDTFAGGGGASHAIKEATGYDPDEALNHDGPALAMHKANHPMTRHHMEDVYLHDVIKSTGNQPVGFLWASPTCTHFSVAKGFNILDQKIRGLCWVILKWAVMVRPRLVVAENVTCFKGYGPLDETGRPIKKFAGRTFKAFVDALTTGLDPNHPDLPEIRASLGEDFPYERIFQGLGYKMEHDELRACDYGAGTIRNRLFMVMRCDGLPINWPAPTHGDPNSEEVKSGKLLPWPVTADCVDWSIKARSIFGRDKNLKDRTLERVGKGLRKFLIDCAEPFLRTVATENGPIQIAPHVTMFRTGAVGHDFNRPIATITAGGKSKRDAGAAHALGIVSAALAPVNVANLTGQDAPGTEVTAYGGETVLTHSHVVKLRGTSTAYSFEEPLHTISAGGMHHAEVRVALARRVVCESRRQQIREFLWAFCPGMAGVEHPERVLVSGAMLEITDIMLRMFTPRELATAQGFPKDYILNPEFTKERVLRNGTIKRITKPLCEADQVRMIGNSVSPPPAIALIKANYFNDMEYRMAA